MEFPAPTLKPFDRTLIEKVLKPRLIETHLRGGEVFVRGDGGQAVSSALARGGTRVCGPSESDPQGWPAAGTTFDGVVCVEALESDAELVSVLEEAQCHLRVGGRAIVEVRSRDHTDTFGVFGNARETGVRVGDLVAVASRLGLRIAAVVPFGAVIGEAEDAQWLRGSLADGPAWYRVLSWASRDQRFRQMLLYIEEAIVARLTSVVSAHSLVVLENEAGDDANERWIDQNRRLNAALSQGFRRENLVPLVGSATWDRWGIRIRDLLNHPPNLIAFYCLTSAAFRRGYEIELESLVGETNAADLRRLDMSRRITDAAVQYAQRFQSDPEIGPLLRPREGIWPALDTDLVRRVTTIAMGLD